MTVKEAGMLKQINFVKLGLNSFSPVANCYFFFFKWCFDQKITRQYSIIQSFSVALYCKTVGGSAWKMASC